MTRNDVTFFLALWGAVTSSTLFIFQLLKFKKEYSGKLKLTFLKVLDEEINITLVNSSFRPITILSYELLYAANEDFYQVITTQFFEQPIKLVESETHSIVIPRDNLIQNVKSNKIEQRSFHTLFLRVTTSSRGAIWFEIPIADVAISRGIDTPMGRHISSLDRYISTDLYMGFAEKQINYRPSSKRIVMK